MTDIQAEQTSTSNPSATAGVVGIAGWALVVIGLVAAAALFTEMAGSGFGGSDYTTADKWLAVLAALTVSGLGLVTAAVSAVLARMD